MWPIAIKATKRKIPTVTLQHTCKSRYIIKKREYRNREK